MRQPTAHHLPHPTQIDPVAVVIDSFVFFPEKDIGAGNPHGFATVAADRLDQSGIDFLGQHPRNDVDRLIGGHAETADKAGLQAGGGHRGGDGLAAAMDHDRPDTGDLQEHDVPHDLGHQLRVFHRRTAHFDEKGFAAKGLQIRQRLNERIGFCNGVHGERDLL